MRQALCILILALASCNNQQGVKIVVYNNSPVTLDSVRISTSDRKAMIKLVDIKSQMKKDKFLNMASISNADGHYLVQIFSGGRHKFDQWGYYTSGYPVEKAIHIYFEFYTIRYKSVFK